MENKSIDVYVGGKHYRIINHDNEQSVLKVASEINSRIEQLQKDNMGFSPIDCALLTAMDICEDCLIAQEKAEDFKRQYAKIKKENEELKKETAKLVRENIELFKNQAPKTEATENDVSSDSFSLFDRKTTLSPTVNELSVANIATHMTGVKKPAARSNTSNTSKKNTQPQNKKENT